jgi:hypothetical protein
MVPAPFSRPGAEVNDLPRELTELIDRQRIHAVLTTYCRALDRCDVDLMKTVYWEDARDEHGVFTGNAQQFAEFIIEGVRNWFEVGYHALCNVHIEFADEATAHAETYMISYCKVAGSRERVLEWFGTTYLDQHAERVARGDGQDFLFGGRYFDRFEKRDGVWRIAKRTVIMDWNLNQPSTDIFAEGMFKSLAVHGRRDRSDPIYARDQRRSGAREHLP